MKRAYQALSIVAPAGQRVSEGKKTLEIRLWRPESLAFKDLLIIKDIN